MYSGPESGILHQTSGALYTCQYTGDANLKVFPTRTIQSVVAMVPCSPGACLEECVQWDIEEVVVYRTEKVYSLQKSRA
jgi:hypothetical protein